MSGKSVTKTEAEWRQELTPEEFRICRTKGTEQAFTGQYYDCKDSGTYRCTCCGQELFRSETKYDSGSGWPSFYTPTTEAAVKTASDSSHGRVRTEVMCSACNAHLGHVFDDGPEPTGLRYCINSVSLKLKKD